MFDKITFNEVVYDLDRMSEMELNTLSTKMIGRDFYNDARKRVNQARQKKRDEREKENSEKIMYIPHGVTNRDKPILVDRDEVVELPPVKYAVFKKSCDLTREKDSFSQEELREAMGNIQITAKMITDFLYKHKVWTYVPGRGHRYRANLDRKVDMVTHVGVKPVVARSSTIS